MRIGAAAVVILLTGGAAHAESTAELFSSCRELAETKVDGDNVELPQTFDSGACWGAFGIVQTLITHTDRKSGRRVYGVCAPPESTRSQLIAVFVEHARRNPKRLHEDAFLVVRDALSEAFPCRR